MVFNKYYDRALLLMLLGDKSNNEMILNFLKFMPEDMIKYIRNIISLNFHNATIDHFRVVEFDGMNMISNDGCMYTLKCGMVHGLLEIKLNRFCIGQNIDEKIKLSLQPLRIYDLDRELNIGSFSYELINRNDFDKEIKEVVYSKNYNVKKVPFDYLVLGSNGKVISGIVPTDSCFEEISLESLLNDNRFNKVGKKRILNNKRKGYR